MIVVLDTNMVISGLFWKGAPRQVLDLARDGYGALAQTIRPAKIKPVIKADPDDDKLLACAKAAKADRIVSGDSDLLQLKKFGDIPIVSVNELLDQFKPAE